MTAATEAPRATLADLVEAAANVLAWRGFLEFDDYIPDELVTELAELAMEGPCESCPETMTAYLLADHWLARKQEEWERTIPAWTCDCGRVYKVLPRNGENGGDEFYEAAEDGLLGDPAGCIEVDSKGRVKDSDSCRGCGTRFAQTVARQSGRYTSAAPPRGKPGKEGVAECQAALF